MGGVGRLEAHKLEGRSEWLCVHEYVCERVRVWGRGGSSEHELDSREGLR